jgi:hypothetical protein
MVDNALFRKLPKTPYLGSVTKTCPEYGSFSNTVCATALSPVNPRRRSVTPAAIQMWVPLGSEIIDPLAPG